MASGDLATENLPRVPVFVFGEGGTPSAFREPAIILLPESKHLLAFAERGQHPFIEGDSYPSAGTDIVSKVSSDGGITWSKLSLVFKNASQPGAVWDTVHKQVVLNFNGAPHCLDQSLGCGFNLQMTSKDGVTWSPPVPLDGFLGDQGHAAVGHAGLELTHGAHQGRLLFIGHRGAYNEDAVWFTDDGGATYRTSKHTLARGPGYAANATCNGRKRSCGMDEAQLVENRDGRIIANMRWMSSPVHGRGIATSTDSGATFSSITFDSQLRTAVCQASIWQSPQNGDIYYAAPSSELDRTSDFGRTHGTIRRSKTGLPGSWHTERVQVTSPCMYNYSSRLCHNNATTVYGYGCLTDVPQKGRGGLLWESVNMTVFSTFALEF